MRMWMLPPETMCRKHLLGEHVELHMLLGSLRRGKNIDGFLAGKLVDPRRMFRRHEELVLEMERRGYRHASPLEEPRVCATCARYFDFDRMCNVPEAVEKLLRERFGIVLGGSEFAVEPEKITDCAAWVSARLIDRYALLRAKQDGKAAARAASAPAARHVADAASGFARARPYPPGGRRTPYGQPGGARPVV